MAPSQAKSSQASTTGGTVTISLSRRLIAVIVSIAGALLIGVAALLIFVLLRSSPGPSTPAGEVSTQSPSPSAEDAFGGLPTVEVASGKSLPGLMAAQIECNPESGPHFNFFAELTLGADQRVLEVDGVDADMVAGYLSGGLGTEADVLEIHSCVLTTLGAPSGVVERMERTRALDGTQSEEWGGYRVTWTYHPDAGLDAVFSYTVLAN